MSTRLFPLVAMLFALGAVFVSGSAALPGALSLGCHPMVGAVAECASPW